MDEAFTIGGFLRAQAARQPDAEMLTAGGVRRTWSDQYERSSRVAAALQSEGVTRAERVVLVDRNGTPFFDLVFGAAFNRAVTVPVSWRLAPAEIGAIIEDAEPSVVVVHSEYLPKLVAEAPSLASVRRIAVIDDAGPDAPGDGQAGPLSSRVVGLEEWLADREARDPGHRAVAEDVALQLYTSGTTGLPKGVMLSNANIAFGMSRADRHFRVDADTVDLVAMPLFHVGGAGWALVAMSRGGRSVVLRDVDPAEILRLIAAERITETFVVPAVLMALLGAPGIDDADVSSLRTVFYGASPISEDVLVRCLRTFRCDFAQLYGLTETTGAICMLDPEDHDPEGPRRHLLRAAGRPYPDVELRIVEPETGQDVPIGTVGEVWSRSPLTMLGYWRKPEETAAVMSDDGWLRTGDAGYMDDEGFLFLHDRIKDMIVSGGENVYPAEVENVLLSHPAVGDAAVIGVPDDRWGETVKAIVVLDPAASDDPGEPSADELITYCRERLAHFKCPTSVEFIDQLPRNPSGKILKRELRARYWEKESRGIH